VNSPTLDGFAEAAAALTPSAVSQFLASSHWHLESRRDNLREVWRLTGHDGRDEGRIMLPLATDYEDYPARFRDALLALGRIHQWDPSELYERVMATRADLFFVRLDQAGADGAIPFQQADQTLQALHKLLRAAATTTADPAHSHLGRRPTAVTEFLDEDVRLGHTKRGSFVFTIVTRLDGVAGGPLVDVGQIKPFPRRVMETLARGLMTTEQLTRSWDPGVLESPGQFGLSAGFVESLEDMTQQPSLRSLDLSFAWASAVPTEMPQDVKVVLGRDAIGGLPRVREYLVRREEPPRRETLVGLVKSLSWDDSPSADGETASVVLFADVNGKQRNVAMTLSQEDHDWAIIAYRSRIPLTVTGDLTYERRAWRLVGDVKVDPSFLRHYGSLHNGVALDTSDESG
jgi:hypothetical protein